MPRIRPDIRRPDVRSLIRSVAPPWGDTVPTSELYRVYSAQMVKQGREPVSSKLLGQALNQCGQRSVMKRIDGKNVRCRIIREKFMAAEEHDTEPARL